MVLNVSVHALSIAVGCVPTAVCVDLSLVSVLFCYACVVFFGIGKQVKSARLTVKPALGQPVLIPFTYCDAADWPCDGVLLFRLCNFGLSMLMIAAALFSVICVVRIALC